MSPNQSSIQLHPTSDRGADEAPGSKDTGLSLLVRSEQQKPTALLPKSISQKMINIPKERSNTVWLLTVVHSMRCQVSHTTMCDSVENEYCLYDTNLVDVMLIKSKTYFPLSRISFKGASLCWISLSLSLDRSQSGPTLQQTKLTSYA